MAHLGQISLQESKLKRYLDSDDGIIFCARIPYAYTGYAAVLITNGVITGKGIVFIDLFGGMLPTFIDWYQARIVHGLSAAGRLVLEAPFRTILGTNGISFIIMAPPEHRTELGIIVDRCRRAKAERDRYWARHFKQEHHARGTRTRVVEEHALSINARFLDKGTFRGNLALIHELAPLNKAVFLPDHLTSDELGSIKTAIPPGFEVEACTTMNVIAREGQFVHWWISYVLFTRGGFGFLNRLSQPRFEGWNTWEVTCETARSGRIELALRKDNDAFSWIFRPFHLVNHEPETAAVERTRMLFNVIRELVRGSRALSPV